jgi:hypothetical protein
MLFTLEIQHSYTRKALITKMIWKKNQPWNECPAYEK